MLADTASGYYAIIQYSETPESGEFVNIGVALFSSQGKRADVRFSPSARRIKRLFGNGPTPQKYQHLTESFERSIAAEIQSGRSKEQLDKFIRMRTGKIRMTPLRSVLVSDRMLTLQELFDSFVPEPPSGPARGPKVQTLLKKTLEEHKVIQFLDEKPQPVHLFDGVSISAPFGYQNGAYNLIYPVSLKEDLGAAVDNAAPLAIRGQQLWERSMQQKRLIVVGDWDGPEKKDLVEVNKILKDHEVGFYEIDSLEPLFADIRKSFSEHN